MSSSYDNRELVLCCRLIGNQAIFTFCKPPMNFKENRWWKHLISRLNLCRSNLTSSQFVFQKIVIDGDNNKVVKRMGGSGTGHSSKIENIFMEQLNEQKLNDVFHGPFWVENFIHNMYEYMQFFRKCFV